MKPSTINFAITLMFFTLYRLQSFTYETASPVFQVIAWILLLLAIGYGLKTIALIINNE